MATYDELSALLGSGADHDTLVNRIEVACIVAAEAIRTDASSPTNQAQRLVWANEAFKTPRAKATEMLPALLAANAGSPVADITGASDAVIQTAVDAAVNVFAGS